MKALGGRGIERRLPGGQRLRARGAGAGAGEKREGVGYEGSEFNESFSGSTKEGDGSTFGTKVAPYGNAWPIP